jgi:hypothetical protein
MEKNLKLVIVKDIKTNSSRQPRKLMTFKDLASGIFGSKIVDPFHIYYYLKIGSKIAGEIVEIWDDNLEELLSHTWEEANLTTEDKVKVSVK